MTAPGHRLFAQYAHAPNALGYCGPAGSEALEAVACGIGPTVDVPAIARQFTGAWPYQQILAELSGVADPMDPRVVRGYWTGNELTDRVDRERFGRSLLARLASQAGHYWKHLTEDLLPEAAPTHQFHVFGVYPWSRLLGTGLPQPLHILDSCRIRWAKVVRVGSGRVVLRSRPLTFDGTALSLGAERDTEADYRVRAGAFVDGLRAGDHVAVHWDFVCDRLDSEQLDSLEHWTRWQLDHTNRRLQSDC